MRRGFVGLTTALLAAVLAVALTLFPAAGLTAADAAQTGTMRDRFSREVVRPGDQDVSPYDIEHVYELQYRLRWLGLFDRAPTGFYGEVTRTAVDQFKRQHNLRPDGVVGHRAWKILIRTTVQGRADVPEGCKDDGWHACYDRSRHQVNLYRDGRLRNSWLVRGGAAESPTRVGTFRVYYRNIDQVSTMYGNAPMPYSQFFSGGQALHGSRLMMDPFVGHSHGCVNFWVEDARQLWRLTSTRTLWVHVYGNWA